MGMYDNVACGEIPCPVCGAVISEFQTKDRDCIGGMVRIEDIKTWYGTCDECGLWVEFEKPDKRVSKL